MAITYDALDLTKQGSSGPGPDSTLDMGPHCMGHPWPPPDMIPECTKTHSQPWPGPSPLDKGPCINKYHLT